MDWTPWVTPALMIGLFGWLKADIARLDNRLKADISGLDNRLRGVEKDVAEIRGALFYHPRPEKDD